MNLEATMVSDVNIRKGGGNKMRGIHTKQVINLSFLCTATDPKALDFFDA